MRGPPPSSATASARLAKQARARTAPEMAVRRGLHALGLRFRVDMQLPLDGVRRRGDVVFTAAKVVVLIDGCFWHACPDHGSRPKANAEWWREKLEANVARDRDTDRRLREAGWTTVRAWSHEDPEAVVARVAAAVAACREGRGSGPE